MEASLVQNRGVVYHILAFIDCEQSAVEFSDMVRLALKTLIRAFYSDFEENKRLRAVYGLYLSTNIFITVLSYTISRCGWDDKLIDCHREH